jgi:ABC-type nickel/cobalt efflux system permease component RcnA
MHYHHNDGQGMAKHNHKHSESHKQAKRNEGETSTRKLHKDWRVWLVVGIMLAAMIMYVLTLDESIVPSIMRQ